jgi:hypothetical protein
MRASYVKVAEFQRRGVVHFHTLWRLDGVGDELVPPPAFFDAQLLANAIAAALPKVSVPAEASGADPGRLHAHLTPHSMRHAFGDHVARHAGIKNAQALLGHADVGTTQMYTGAPTLDELAKAIEGYRFGVERTHVPPDPQIPLEAPTGIEPVYTALQAAA